MKNSRKYTLISLIVLFVAAMALTSCAGTKKCNGSRGTRTPMGIM